MKNIKQFLFLIVLLIINSCSKDAAQPDLENISAPSAINAKLTVKADNSGTVTIAPTGEGFTKFDVFFGDGTATPVVLAAGESIEHTYLEGNFQVKIIGTTLNGKTTEKLVPLAVTFFAPTDLVVTIAQIPNNSLGITVKAEAKFETGFIAIFFSSP